MRCCQVSQAEADELCSPAASVSAEVQRQSRNVVALQLAKCDVAAFLFDSSSVASLQVRVKAAAAAAAAAATSAAAAHNRRVLAPEALVLVMRAALHLHLLQPVAC